MNLIIAIGSDPISDEAMAMAELLAKARKTGASVKGKFGCPIRPIEITIDPQDKVEDVLEQYSFKMGEMCRVCKEETADVEVKSEMTFAEDGGKTSWEELKNVCDDDKFIIFVNDWARYMEAWRAKNNGKLSIEIITRTYSFARSKQEVRDPSYFSLAGMVLSSVWIHGDELTDTFFGA